MSPTWQAYPGSGKAGKPHRLKLPILNFIILLYNLPLMIDMYQMLHRKVFVLNKIVKFYLY